MSFNYHAPNLLSVDDARALIAQCKSGRSAYRAARVEVFPRPTRLGREVRRRAAGALTLGLGAAWLALPRESVAGLFCLMGAVALGRVLFERWRKRRA